MIPTKETKSLYFQMLRIRRIEEFLAQRNSTEPFPQPVNFSLGREAIAVGVCHSTTSTDLLFKRLPNVAFALAKGVTLQMILKKLTEKTPSSWQDASCGFMEKAKAQKGSLTTPIESALKIKQEGSSGVVLNFLDNESNAESSLQEQLNFASSRKLPIIFVVENNPYGYEPTKESESISFIFRRGESLGIPGMHVDGNNVKACTMRTAIGVDRARNGYGPTIIEFRTQKNKNLTVDGKGNLSDIHTELKACPLFRLEESLINDGELTKQEKQMALNRIESEIQRALNTVEDFPVPLETPDQDILSEP